MQVGTLVRVLPPFNSPYDSVYAIEKIEGDTYFLVGIYGGFCADYLEVYQ